MRTSQCLLVLCWISCSFTACTGGISGEVDAAAFAEEPHTDSRRSGFYHTPAILHNEAAYYAGPGGDVVLAWCHRELRRFALDSSGWELIHSAAL